MRGRKVRNKEEEKEVGRREGVKEKEEVIDKEKKTLQRERENKHRKRIN